MSGKGGGEGAVLRRFCKELRLKRGDLPEPDGWGLVDAVDGGVGGVERTVDGGLGDRGGGDAVCNDSFMFFTVFRRRRSDRA